MENKMFCYQCQETAGCKGCTVSGVCGKKPETAALQDGLIYSTKGLAQMLTILRKNGAPVTDIIIPTGTSVGLNIVRPAVSAATTIITPRSAEEIVSPKVLCPTILRAI